MSTEAHDTDAAAEVVRTAHYSSASLDMTLIRVRRAIAGLVLVGVLCVIAIFAVVAVQVNAIDRTVTSHDNELAATLDAACVLIRSDPKLPLPNECKGAKP